ncbi:MAG: hypothetical protein JXK05_02645 [Campylobacterales bacterium]|nr:hypothetical protein [Campylobacterales bacterium]
MIKTALLFALLLAGCTQETQNKIGRGIQNWTGTDGVVDIYAGEKLIKRFIQVDKLSTGKGTDDGKPRAYRYGYGYDDLNFNFVADKNEKKIYFEVGEFTTHVFYENTQVSQQP